MAYIGREPTVGNFQVCDAISVVNNQAAYTMQVGGVNVSPETANHMLVSLNGVLQAPGSSYTVSGSTITFASNLVTGDVINFIHILGSVLDLGVPSDNTVSLAKLTATGTKDATTFLRGDNTFAEAGGGKVLQVLTATDSTIRSTTSSTFTNASTTLSLTITPSSTSSKILINITTGWYDANTGGTAYISIFRDSTNLGNSTTGMLSMALQGMQSVIAMTHLDSPSSTSALTYELRMRCGAGTSNINQQSSMGNIVVMEIGS